MLVTKMEAEKTQHQHALEMLWLRVQTNEFNEEHKILESVKDAAAGSRRPHDWHAREIRF